MERTREELLAEIECLQRELERRRRVEEGLRESEARLRSVLESAPNPIITADRDGVVTFASRVGPGLSMEQVVGHPAWRFVAPEDQGKVTACLRRVLASGKTDAYEVRGRSGRHYTVTVGPIRIGDDITGVTFVGWDVTELRELQARMMISDRLASTQMLGAGVAHEINNPLTYVLANLRWLEQDIAGSETPARAWVAAALEGAEHIRSVVSALVGVSRVNDARKVLVDVRQLLDSAARLTSHELNNRARLVRRYEEVPSVLANDAQLGQVFVNLLKNAAQAIPEGTPDRNTITLVTRRCERGRVMVEVRDTGAGMTPEIVGRVFEPFFTTKPAGQGTGLGLSICRNIVTALDGDIHVESLPAEGSVFRVTLPTPGDGDPADG